jgi:hypothetical protein
VDAQTLLLTWEDNSAVEDGYQVWASTFELGDEIVAELPASSTSHQINPPVTQGCIEDVYPTIGVGVTATRDGGSSDFVWREY